MAAKLIYFYDDQKHLDHSELVDETAVVPTGATDIRPADGLYEPLTFTGTEWVGVTREEWLANSPEQPAPVPTAEQQMINALGQQVAALTAQLAAQGGAE